MASEQISICLMTTISGHELDFYRRKMKEFAVRHGVEINLHRVSWNKAFSWLIESFKNNNAPDVIQLGTTWVQAFARLGYLDIVPADIIRPVLADWMKNICRLGGEWVAFPWFVEIRALLVWNDILNYLGNDCSQIGSSEDFYRICQRLADTKNSNIPPPFAFPIRPDAEILHRFSCWHWAEGREFPSFSSMPEKILTLDSFQDTLKYVSRLIRSNAVSRSELQKHSYRLYREFADKQYVFYQGNWETRVGEEYGHSLPEYNIIPLPVSDEGKHWGGGSVLAVSAMSGNREISWRLVKFITRDEFINSWVKVNCNMMAFECEFWDKFRSLPGVESGFELVKNSISYPAHPLWASVEKILSRGLSNYFWHICTESSEPREEDISSCLIRTDRTFRKLLDLQWRGVHND